MHAYRLAYDGRPFHGFQRQPDVPTVEDTLFGSLRELGVLGPESDKPHGYAAAGRTDAGVSAVAQTVSFTAPDWLSPAAVNAELPPAVRVWASTPVPDGFHATHDAVRRTYRYHLYAPEAAITSARTAAARLSGAHDFHNLSADDEGTVRELECQVDRDDDFLLVTVTADGFPRQLVRRLVTVIHGIATDTADLDWIDRLFDTRPVDGPAGVSPAPPTPLVLCDVTYPDVSFEADSEAVAQASDAFSEKAATAMAAGRTMSAIDEWLTETLTSN